MGFYCTICFVISDTEWYYHSIKGQVFYTVDSIVSHLNRCLTLALNLGLLDASYLLIIIS